VSIKHLSGSGLYTGSKNIKLWDQTTVQNDFQSIATVVVPAAGQSSVVFNNIPQNFTHLQVRGSVRIGATGSTLRNLCFQINGDTGSNYITHDLLGNASSASAGIPTSGATTKGYCAVVPDNSASASFFGTVILEFVDYSNTSKLKTVRSLLGTDLNGSGYSGIRSSLWFKAGIGVTSDAITSITMIDESANSFAQYTQFALYGKKVAS